MRSLGEPLETCTPRSSPQRPTRKQWRPRGEWGVVCVWAGWCAACVLGVASTGCVHVPPLLQRPDGLQGGGPAFRPSPQRPAPCDLMLKFLHKFRPVAHFATTSLLPALLCSTASSLRGPTRRPTCLTPMACRTWGQPSGRASSTTLRWTSSRVGGGEGSPWFSLLRTAAVRHGEGAAAGRGVQGCTHLQVLLFP